MGQVVLKFLDVSAQYIGLIFMGQSVLEFFLDVSAQHIGPIFMGQAVLEFFLDCLTLEDGAR
jgi:hypothetical protein